MRAAILAVGSELLGTERVDTNSLRLTEVLDRHGVELVAKLIVGDDAGRLATAVTRLLREVDLLLITGGLGPTADDRTRQGVAAALGRDLRRDEAVVAEIRDKFASLGREMPAVNVRQADVIEGAELIQNPRGTAPGLRLVVDDRTLFLFPGVPRELEGMVEGTLEPWLRRRDPRPPPVVRVLRIACLPESEVEERLAPVYDRFGTAGVALLPASGEIELRLTAEGPEAADRATAMAELSRACLGAAVYSDDRRDTLEAVVGRLLIEAGETLATAESCTGGLVAERLTRVPGSSACFAGAIVAYGNRAKAALLGVPEEVIESRGAVSREVAEAMAVGCRQRFATHWALAVTGIAGPSGGSAEKPVGTVHLAIAGSTVLRHQQARFPGDRRMVRRLAAQSALDLLRLGLSE